MNLNDMYMLKPGDVDALADTRDFPQMLDLLRNRSHLFNNLIDEPYCDKPYYMVDKTPRYVYPMIFERILEKTHDVPVVVMKKSYEMLKASWAKRKAKISRVFYDQTYNNVEKMISKYPNRIIVVNYYDMLHNVESVMQEIFHFLRLEWRTDYLRMTNLRKKFANYGHRWLKYTASWKWKSNG